VPSGLDSAPLCDEASVRRGPLRGHSSPSVSGNAPVANRFRNLEGDPVAAVDNADTQRAVHRRGRAANVVGAVSGLQESCTQARIVQR
jgi:hypothetical protein